MITTLLLITLAQAPAADADALFQSAKRAMAKKDYAAACPAFEASHRAEPALGTLLNLADCYDKAGRATSAWLRFNEAAQWAQRNKEANRETFALRRAAELKPRLSYIAIQLDAPVAGLVLWLDGQQLPAAQAQSFPVDLGRHEVRATAPMHEDWKAELLVTVPGSSTPVEIPRLKSSLASPPLALESFPEPTVSVKAEQPNRTLPLMVTASGATLVAAGVGGLVYCFSGNARAMRQQPGGPDALTPSVTRSEFETMGKLYPLSWAAVGLGAAVLTGGVVWLSSESRPQAAPKLLVGVGDGAASVSVQGRF